MRANTSRRRMVACLVGVNTLIYGISAAYSAFMPVYLTEYHSSIVKGNLLSIGCVASLFAPVLIGKITDRSRSKARVLALLVLLSAVLFVASYLNHTVAYLAVVVTAFSFCKSTFGGLVDTTTLEYSAASDVPYGPIRMMGTIGYGLVAVLMGVMATRNLGFVFAAYPVIAAGGIVCLLLGPQVPGHASKKEKLHILPILKDRNLVILFLLNGVAYFCYVYFQHFYNEYVLGDLGLPTWVWGVTTFATISLEIPFFFVFDKLMRKIPLKVMLAACMVVSAARYLLLPSVSTITGILLTSAFTGGWITFITYCVTLYIQRNLSPALIASGIGLQYALAVGMGTFLADFGGGYLTNAWGVRGTMLFCAALCAVALPTVALIRPKPRA